MTSLYARCSQCNRVIYASQAAENDGVCGADCPRATRPAPARPPREKIAPPVPPPPSVDEATLTAPEAPVGLEEEVFEALPALPAEGAPEARQSAPGANRMHRAERGGSR